MPNTGRSRGDRLDDVMGSHGEDDAILPPRSPRDALGLLLVTFRVALGLLLVTFRVVQVRSLGLTQLPSIVWK